MADAFIISYPKSGRTWLNIIFNSVREFDKDFPFICFTHDIFNEYVQDAIKFYQVPEYFNRKEIMAQRFKMYNKKPLCLLTRDPRDALTSYYHQKKYREPALARMGIIKDCVKIEIGIDDFVLSDIWGVRTIIAFYNEWAKTGIETISYENLVKNTYKTIRRYLKKNSIKFDKKILKKVILLTNFDRLQKIEIKRAGKDTVDMSALKMRRGIIGSHKDELRPVTIKKIDEIIKTELDSKFKEYFR